MTQPTTQRLVIEQWHPARLNALTSQHWAKRNRAKKADKRVVGLEALAQGITPATGRRRVSLTIGVAKGKREADPDAYWKSLLDALVDAGLLIDDNRDGVEHGTVEFERSPDHRRWTVITLEDVPPAEPIKRADPPRQRSNA